MEYGVVPKVEKENPSTLDLSEHILPAIKDWKLGQRYLVKLEVEAVDQRKGSMYDPNESSEVRSSFKVLGAQSLEREDSPNGEMKEKSNKQAFVRAMIGIMKNMED